MGNSQSEKAFNEFDELLLAAWAAQLAQLPPQPVSEDAAAICRDRPITEAAGSEE